MLVLTRKKGQSIMLGDGIEISVVEINGDAVRIGIKAPKDMTIYRREIYEAIQDENIRASKAALKMAGQLKKMLTTAGKQSIPDKQTTTGKQQTASGKQTTSDKHNSSEV